MATVWHPYSDYSGCCGNPVPVILRQADQLAARLLDQRGDAHQLAHSLLLKSREGLRSINWNFLREYNFFREKLTVIGLTDAENLFNLDR